MDTTILIQGSLNVASLQMLKKYSSYGDILVSCWKGDTLMLPENCVTKVITTDPNCPAIRGRYDYANVFKQALSTFNGLKKIGTRYTIKIRSDEYYTDLSNLIKVMKSDPHKLTTNNVFFREDSFLKYHPSDHVIASETTTLLNTFSHLLGLLSSVPNSKETLPAKSFGFGAISGRLVPEQLICLSFLKHKGIVINPSLSKEQMRENINLVRVSDMGSFKVTANVFNTSFSNEEDMLWCRGMRSITSMDEL